MIISKDKIKELLAEMSKCGDVFLNEKQFQFALAWKLRNYFELQEKNDYHIFLEYPSENLIKGEARKYYDIVIEKDNEFCVIELKYKTKKGEVVYNGQTFPLKNQAAQDLGRYDFVKDITRIENFEKDNNKKLNCGYALFMTNDRTYWELGDTNKFYRDFALNGTEISSGKKEWNRKDGVKENSVGKNRIEALKLDKDYDIKWDDYNETFKYLLINI